jgi:hypothetical protein
MSYFSQYTYADWQDYLANGRKKYERPLYSNRGWRIQYANKFNKQSDIQITASWLSNHPIITIHTDNTRTLSAPASIQTAWGGTWNPLRSHNVRYSIWKFTAVEVKQRNYQYYIYERNAGLTPSKIQGCRTCKQSGLVDSWCSPTYCWDVVSNNGVISCPTHPDEDMLKANYGRHMMPCPHGDERGHTVKRGGQCHACQGTRKRDYGNKRISVPWDGSPIRVQEGNIYKQPLTDLERIVAAYAGPTS